MEKWENPAAVSENLLPPRPCIGQEKLSLGGKWRFFAQPRELDAPEGWTNGDFNDKKWSRISVPGPWNGQEGTPDPSAPVTGFYRKSFLLARNHGSRQIILRFEDVRCSVLVWVNGTCIGMAKGMHVPAEFDISSAVRPEKNIVCVQVSGATEGSGFPGILGDVFLYSLPQRIISRLQTRPQWQDDGSAMLHVALQTRNADGFTARIALMDGSQVIGYRECPIRDNEAAAVIPCPDVQLWSADQPKLYRVAVILWDGVAIHHTTQTTVGFRRVCIQNHRFTINDQPEKLFGVAYLPHNPETGSALPKETMEADLSRIREHNMNGVLLPCSAPEGFFDLCDRMGMYVVFAGGITPSDAVPEAQASDQNQRMELLYGVHPSIVLWNLSGDHPGILSPEQIAIVNAEGSEPPAEEGAAFLRYPGIPRNGDEILSRIRTSDSSAGAVFGTYQEDHLKELKHLLQPVGLEYENGVLTVTNFSRCRSTDPYLARYRLTRDGETVVERELNLTLGPNERKSIPLETQYDIYKSGRYYLSVEYLRRDTGSVTAFAQWPAAHLRHIFDENPGGTIREDSGSLILKSGNAVFTVSRAFASIDQIALDDLGMLCGPVCPVYRKAADRAGGFRLPDEWDKLSSGRKKLKPSVLEVDHMTRTVVASFKLGSGLMQTLRLYADGSMAVELRLRTGRTVPSMLGVRFPLKRELDQFRWFGLGPDDPLPGQSAGQFFGNHHQTLVPGAWGQKEPVYSLTVTDRAGRGIQIRWEEGLRAGFSGDGDCNHLLVALPVDGMMPHTTYTLSFSIQPLK